MKKIIVFLILVLFLVSCAKPQIEPLQTKQAKQTLKETTKEETPTKTIDDSKLTPELKQLLSKVGTEVKSYTYIYGEPPLNRLLDTYYVKGDKIKIKLYEQDPYKIENYFDTVFLDTSEKTAKGYCLNKKRCILHAADNTKKVFDLNYEDYSRKTPVDWAKEIQTGEIKGKSVYESRSTVQVETKEGDKMVSYWLDERYGLPLKIVIAYDDGSEEIYLFRDMTINSLKDQDVNVPFVVED